MLVECRDRPTWKSVEGTLKQEMGNSRHAVKTLVRLTRDRGE